MVEDSTSKNGLTRRTMIRSAAWSLPVIGLAAATPMASASGVAGAAWTGGSTTLLTLSVFDAGDTISASVLPSAPTLLRIQGGGAPLPNVTITIATSQNPGLGIALGIGTRTLRGYAPASITGTAAGALTRTPRTLGSVLTTTYVATDTNRTFTLGNIAAHQVLSLPVSWGATKSSWSGFGIADVSLLTSYSVTVTLRSNGTQFAQVTAPGISIPAVAGLL